MSHPFRSPIARKLVWYFVAISTVTALFSTVVQLYLDYRQDVGSTRDYLASLRDTYLPSLAKNTWIMDDNQILTLLDGITNREDIIFAAIQVDDRERWASGKKTGLDRLHVQLPIHYTHGEKTEVIGTLTVIADLERVYQRLARRVIIVLLTNAVKTFIVAGLALLVVQQLVTRHLQAMASHVSALNFNREIAPLQLDREKKLPADELDTVSEAIASMQKRGYVAYRALQKNEQRLRLFLNSTEEGVFGTDSQGTVLFANSMCLNLLALSNDHTLIGKRAVEIFTTHCHCRMHSQNSNTPLLEAIADGHTFSCEDNYIERPDGSGFYASLRSYPTLSGDHCTGAVVFFSDTSRHRELHRQMKLLKEALDNSPISVLIADRNLTIEFVNPGFIKSSGYGFDEVVGKKVDFLSTDRVFKETYQTVVDEALQGRPWQGRLRYQNKAGETRVVDVVISPLYHEDGQVTNVVAVSHDVTYEVELQGQLITAQKLKALGRLSASIVHEFGNPLIGIRSLLRDFDDRLELSSADRELLDLASRECEQMQTILDNFHDFYGSEKSTPAPCSIKNILDKMISLHRKTFMDHNIVTLVEHADELPDIMGREDQLAQVFLNIALNAVDAMSPVGGTLRISTSLTQQMISLTFTDTGCGMSERIMDHIFEPFFSTKHEIEGTGLGLPVSYGIVTAHNGTISCSSKEHIGSTFKVCLPVTNLFRHAA